MKEKSGRRRTGGGGYCNFIGTVMKFVLGLNIDMYTCTRTHVYKISIQYYIRCGRCTRGMRVSMLIHVYLYGNEEDASVFLLQQLMSR